MNDGMAYNSYFIDEKTVVLDAVDNQFRRFYENAILYLTADHSTM